MRLNRWLKKELHEVEMQPYNELLAENPDNDDLRMFIEAKIEEAAESSMKRHMQYVKVIVMSVLLTVTPTLGTQAPASKKKIVTNINSSVLK